jgi:hypothetical protein
MTKQGLGTGIIVALVIVLGVGSYITYQKHMAILGGQNNPTPTPGVFNSSDIGISFTYPKNYELTVADDEEGAVKIITLMDKANLPVGQNTEGPPAISVQRFDNPKNLPLDEWVRTTGASNWQLSAQGEMGASTVGDEAGLGYKYSGLYEVTAVAVAHNGKVYLFTVDTLTPDDQIKADFFSLLDTVTFI